MTTVVDLIRHGEPVGGKKYRGWLDDPLSKKGWRQMWEAVGDDCPWEVIVTSPLIRCAAFAEELAARHQLPLVTEPRLKEMGFGAWEGCTAEELLTRDRQILERFWRDPVNNTPPGGETLHQFQARVIPAWDDLVSRYAGRHLLLVGHAGITRMILGHVLGVPLERLFRIQVENAGITQIQVDHHQEGLFPRFVSHGAGARQTLAGH